MHYIAEVQGTVCLESGKHGQRNLHWRKKRMRKYLADVKAVLYFFNARWYGSNLLAVHGTVASPASVESIVTKVEA